MVVGDYTLTYESFQRDRTPEKEINQATIAVSRAGSPVTTLRPQSNFHIAQRQPQSEVAIRTTPVEDLYVVVTQFDRDGSAAVRAFVNPLTWWIWAGAAVMAGGMSIILSGSGAQSARAEVPARAQRSLRPATALSPAGSSKATMRPPGAGGIRARRGPRKEPEG